MEKRGVGHTMRGLLKYFFQGLILVVPITVTLYIIWEVFLILDGLIPINIPGLGLLLIIIFVTVLGVVSRHLLSEQVISIFEGIVKRAPLINVIYTAVRDLMNAFVGNKKSFSKPVLVKLYENSEIRRMGFITNNNFEKLSDTCDLITVYLPHSYNISGNMFLVPARYIEPLRANASDVMKYAVSGGVTEIEMLSELAEQQTKGTASEEREGTNPA